MIPLLPLWDTPMTSTLSALPTNSWTYRIILLCSAWSWVPFTKKQVRKAKQDPAGTAKEGKDNLKDAAKEGKENAKGAAEDGAEVSCLFSSLKSKLIPATGNKTDRLHSYQRMSRTCWSSS